MAMAQSPGTDARNRYNANFHSTIFEPPSSTPRSHFVPAGKRRDQTTSEMFGNYDDKDLRAMPKTFVPKEHGRTAHEMKMHFLKSEVLPCSNYPARGPEPSTRAERIAAQAALMDPNVEENVDTRMKRQEELSSKLFGRETPGYDSEQVPARGERQPENAPSDFTWHSYPEPRRSPRVEQDISHAHRAYQEKCSSVFDHRSPEVPEDLQARRLAREQDDGSEQLRRSNAHYSDLFGRGALMLSPRQAEQEGKIRRAKFQGTPSDQITVHQDWTDMKTELLGGPNSGRPEQPALRKSEELHHTRIFFDEAANYQPPDKVLSMTHDNSDKVRTAVGRGTQEIHQAHMRTSVAPVEFYERAEATKQWEVIELHVSGLPRNAEEGPLRKLCQGFDLQIVRVEIEMDPVRNQCRGRGKIMLRHNAQQAAVAGLVRRLEEANLRVEV